MWIVYKPSPESPLEAIELPNHTTSQQISYILGYVNWYGSSKKTKEAAISEAKEDGFEFGQSPKTTGIIEPPPKDPPMWTHAPILEDLNLGWD